ncbi:MarR family transcriptional regulator [Actinocatenispora thailandica]|uniref:MarR family transcriptional regulator n=1 Tax=Actinocatenispora thailandica TaxID=227318 RepID=A0A7R7DRK1_9ACTN|nr:MarR family transcriptional regulator [Actinocatenispora thailandica]BCJ36509.1 MarR family transcriptional regulator [Actinocatenispora thailandica]
MSGTQVTSGVARDANELRLSVMRLVRRLRAERPASGLSLTRVNVLGRLDREGPATMSDLAAAEGITPQSMARTVGELVDAGLLTRRADPDDGRRQLLDVTPAARRLLAEDRSRRDSWLAVALTERLSAEERAMLRIAGRLLDRLAEG